MSKHEIQIEKTETEWKVKLGGVIDEDADFSSHDLAGAPAVELHLSAVKSINSCGIREWIKWIATAQNAPVQYFECPKIIVDQINMVQGFLPSQGRVMSFFVPYYSEDSGEEKNVLFRNGQEFGEGGLLNPPDVKGDDGATMEMDVVEAKYFKFLKK